MRNRYSGKCKTCKTELAVEAGFAEKIEGKWSVFCSECVPHKITDSAAQQHRVLTSDGKIIMGYEPNNIPLIKSLPKARWDKENKWWSVSLEMADRARILEIADRIGLEVAPNLRTVAMTSQAEKAASLGLYPFQVTGVNFLAHKKKALLGDEMGLGKSVQSLMGIPHDGAAMVICRAGLKYNWVDEVKKWRPDLTPVVLNGRESFRWPDKGEVVIINNEILSEEFNTPTRQTREPMQAYWSRLAEYRNDLKSKNSKAMNVHLIIDEAHDYKNRKAARTRKTKEIASLCAKVTGLTGSPLTNRPEDLFGVLDTLGLAKEAFGSYERFQTLFNATRNTVSRRGISVTNYGKPQPIVPELLRRVMLRRRREEVLPDLPSKTYTSLLVGTDNKALKAKLDEMWQQWEGVVVNTNNLPPFEQFAELRADLAKSRINEMLTYVENAEEQDCPLVVFSAHLAPLDALLGRSGWAIITGDTSPERRQEIVREFQAGHLKGVGISIRAGGVGLTLTHAWKALFVDLDWTPASNWQAEDRICRIGQTANKVEIVRMVSDHPLDLHVQKLLVEKIDTINRSIDKTINGEKKQGLPVGSEPITETETEFEARMARVLERQKEIEKTKADENAAKTKAYAKSKVDEIHAREVSRYAQNIPTLTSEQVKDVRDAFKQMLAVCDGAREKDNVGFNKPDAVVAHLLLSAGLETEKEVQAGYCILARYHRQLAKTYPAIFQKKSGVA